MESIDRERTQQIKEGRTESTRSTDSAKENVKYALTSVNEDGIEVYVTSEETKKFPLKERKKRFLNLMREEYKGRTAKFIVNGKAYYATFDKKDLQKNIYGDQLSSLKGWKAKINTGADGAVFELVENSRYIGNSKESGKDIKAHKGITDWDYFVKKVEIDGVLYDLVANVRKNSDNQYVYSIQLNENKRRQTAQQKVNKTFVNQARSASVDDSVSQKSETVNTHSMQNGKKYAVSDSYSQEIDEWYKSGKSDNESFALGSTGDVLQGLGAIESDIYMNSDKINRILDKHKEITVAEIKKIPEILEDPVLILKSQNKDRGGKQNTRLIIFGSVKGQDGRPVLSVLDLRPVENNLAIDDMQKVSSVYTKDNNPVEFVKASDIVYADKKRTANLLKSIGFQMPIELRQSGYIGSISYIKRSVNIQGEKFSDVFDTAANTYSTQTDEKYAVSDEETGDDRWKKIRDAECGLKSADETVRSLKRCATNTGRS